MTKRNTFSKALFSMAALVTLGACVESGGGGTVATGAAGGGTSVGANEELERCDSPLGTLAIVEDLRSDWVAEFARSTGQRSITPVLKMIIQQSNCFQVVSRSASSKAARNQERAYMDSGEARGGSNMGKGLLKVADYSMEVSVLYANSDVGSVGAMIGGLLGNSGIGAVAGGLNQRHTSVALNVTDVRSTQQVSASEGSSSTTNFLAGLAGLGGSMFGGAGGYTDTPEGKALAAAFMDAYNKMVVSLKNYTVQSDPSGRSGRGGSLAVD